MRKLLIAFFFGVLSSFPALANWTGKDATPATITFYNPGACTSVVCVPVVQITDGTNQVTLTTAGADGVSNTLTGQPVYGRNLVFNGTTWDRWTGAVTVSGVATAALQSTGNTSLASILTNQTSGGQKTQRVDGSGNVAPAGDVAARAIFEKVTDGTNTMAVKAASTAPAGADPAAVVSISPNGNSVAVASSVLPTGGSTSANQSTEIGSLATIATNSGSQATAANQATGNTSLATIATNSGLPLPAQSTHTVNVGAVDQISPYPAGAVPLTASATGTTAATTATLAGTTGKTTYVCGYSIRANATANTNVTNTLTGVISGTMSSIMWVPANTAGLGVDEQIFSPCIPASAANTAINAVSGAPGTGGLVSSKIWGYQL